MTLQELINWFSANEYKVLAYFASILILALITVVLVTQNNFRQMRYFMSALIYAVTIPGILATLLVFYSLFFLKTNLLNVNILAYFIPIVAMIATLVILNKKVAMKDIPGFNKLSALMIMISISFGIIFVLQKTYFGVFFVGGFSQLIIVFIVLLIVLKIAWSRIIK